MRRFLTILCLALAVFTTANAQTFLNDLRKIETGKGAVTVVQSEDIDKLVNGNGNNNTTIHNNAQQSATSAEQSKVDHQTESDPLAQTEHAQKPADKKVSKADDDKTTTVVDNRKKVMRNSYKRQGYRIQVFSGNNSRQDRQKAESAGAVMKSHFPNEPIYVHFYSPSWKCRMGNYTSESEASAILAKVKKLGYPHACIVKGTISVQY